MNVSRDSVYLDVADLPATAAGGDAKMAGYFVFLVDVSTEKVFDGLNTRSSWRWDSMFLLMERVDPGLN